MGSNYLQLHMHPKLGEWMAQAEDILGRVLVRSQKGWARTVDTQAAVAVVRELADGTRPYGLEAVVLNDSHLLIYQLAPTWFAPSEKLIIEQFFVRLDKGPTSEALAALDALAKDAGATGIVMATSLAANDKALGRLLGSHGYSAMSSNHWRAVN